MQKIIMIVGIPHDIMLVEIRESTEQPCILQENLQENLTHTHRQQSSLFSEYYV